MSKNKHYRKCFESNLAAEILNNPEHFPAVEQLSVHILNLLKRDINKNKILNNSILDSSVSSQLYSNVHFGRISGELNDCPTSLRVYEAILQALENSGQNLQLTLHIHQIFMQKIYDQLPDKTIKHPISSTTPWSKLSISERIAHKLVTNSPEKIKQAVVSNIFTKELFAEVARIKLNQTGLVTNTIGISDQEECPDLQETETHQTVLGVFGTKDDSKWLKEISALNLPCVAGPSGHAGSALLVALMLGNFNHEQLKQYITANIGILTGGGYHTIHEIMRVAKEANIPYEDGQYYQFLPDSFKKSEAYTRLAEQYPDFLPSFDRFDTQEVSSSNQITSFFTAIIDKVNSGIDQVLLSALNAVNDNHHLNPPQQNQLNTHSFFVTPKPSCPIPPLQIAGCESPPSLSS